MHLKLEMHLQRQVCGISNTKIETYILLDHVECVLFVKDPIHYKRVNSYLYGFMVITIKLLTNALETLNNQIR